MLDSAWQVEVDRVTAAEWWLMLDLFDDANLYQTWSYGAVRWREKNLSHLVLKRGGEVLGIAQLRIVRPTSLKFGMAYLRWGPLYQRRGRPVDPEIPKILARALEEEYVGKRKLFLRILPNVFANTSYSRSFLDAFAPFKAESLKKDNTYRTFLVDLAPSLEELRKRLDPKWRNKLSGAEKNGLEVVQEDSTAGGEDLYTTFCQIYRQMRLRKSFETTVDVDEFGRIQQDLPERHRMKVLICKEKGKPVAGLVVSAMGNTAIYLLGATSDEGLKSKGAYLLQWTMMKWLKEQGIRWYDLGGIDPEVNPGVYSFKKGFSGADVTQLNPLVACDSLVSSAVVRASLALRRMLGECRGALHFVRPMSPQATRS
jgi:lipid II:glycine glycyltransferase (peptidoglycan interpeptide bridge formation enzyme)